MGILLGSVTVSLVDLAAFYQIEVDAIPLTKFYQCRRCKVVSEIVVVNPEGMSRGNRSMTTPWGGISATLRILRRSSQRWGGDARGLAGSSRLPCRLDRRYLIEQAEEIAGGTVGKSFERFVPQPGDKFGRVFDERGFVGFASVRHRR